MTLRRKFAIIIASAVLAPFLVAAIVGYSTVQELRRDERLRESLPVQLLTLEHVRRSVDGTGSPHALRGASGRYVLIRQSDGQILDSSVDALAPGTAVTMDEVTERFRDEIENGHLAVEFTTDLDGQSYALVYPVSLDFRPVIDQFRKTRYPMGVFMILLAAGAAMSVILVNRTARSILLLQEATKKLAEGDMAFELPDPGGDEIGELTRSFVNMRDRLKEETAKRARFLMAVSHDLATPLTSIEGYVEAIQDGFAEGDPERLDKYLNIVRTKTQLLEDRIESLIDLAHIETGEWKLRHENVPLGEFLEDIATVFREDAAVANRRFVFSSSVSPDLTVPLDPTLVTRALENLFSNAIRYTGEGEEIDLVAGGAPGPVETQITVRDTGRGIPADEVRHIFDPFYRGEAFTATKGFGLGLSIVHAVITGHGWDIRVESAEGEGTTFTITIPAT